MARNGASLQTETTQLTDDNKAIKKHFHNKPFCVKKVISGTQLLLLKIVLKCK